MAYKLGDKAAQQVGEVVRAYYGGDGPPPDRGTRGFPQIPPRLGKLTDALAQGSSANVTLYRWDADEETFVASGESGQRAYDKFMAVGDDDLPAGTWVLIQWVGVWLVTQTQCQ